MRRVALDAEYRETQYEGEWLRPSDWVPLSVAELEAVAKSSFHKIDMDNSGVIDCDELIMLVASTTNGKVSITRDDAKFFIQSIDENDDGFIDEREWIAFLRNGVTATQKARSKFQQQSALHAQLLHVVDAAETLTRRYSRRIRTLFGSSAHLDHDGLKRLTHNPSDDEVSALMSALDKDGSGTLEREEFAAYILYGLNMGDEWRQNFRSQSHIHGMLADLIDRVERM